MTSSEDTTAGSAPDAAAPAGFVHLRTEYVDTATLVEDPAKPVATPLMGFCSAILGAMAIRPDECTLAITGDFVSSVRDRLPDGPYRDGYGVERGAGMVGGKTMLVENGVHVVLPSWLFIASDENDAQADGERDRLTRRTVIHEAQHVSMIQAGEGDESYEDSPWARRNFLTVADQVISEYRAELAVLSEFRADDDDSGEGQLESLRTLRKDFRRIAAVEYQEHRDVDRLAYEIVQEAHTAWKMLAYLAASRAVAEVNLDDPVPAALGESEEWTLMGERRWAQFESLLGDIPPGAVRVDRAELATWTSLLADLLVDWLREFGFEWVDIYEGSVFNIVDWDLFT